MISRQRLIKATRVFLRHPRRQIDIHLETITSSTQGEIDMRFGLFTGLGAQTWAGVLDLWRHVEETGWDIACVTDHFMPPTADREGAVLESWSTLSALAALVPRIRVGTIVL